MSQFTHYRAANGLQVLLVPRDTTEAVTVEFLFRAGSRYETPATNGLAHFNEHMVFKGSEKYPTFRDVNDTLTRVGAVNNAFTSSELTGFWAKVPAEHAEVPLDVLSDMLTKPQYDAAELDRERGVIIEEINMYEDDPAATAGELLEKVLYPDHPLGRSTLGPKKNISSFPREAFIEYARQHHTPDRGILIVAGNLKHLPEKAIETAVARFDGASDEKPVPWQSDQTAPALGVRHKKTEQTHLAMGFRAPSMQDRDKSVILAVLAMALGGTMSSRLFVEVREHQGLAYYVGAAADQYIDTGTLFIKAGVTNEKAAAAVTSILKEAGKVKNGELTEDELTMAKESLKGRLAFRWEDSTRLGEYFGEDQLLLGKTLPTDQILKMIGAVTVEDATTLAQDIIKDEHLNVAVVGPHNEATFKDTLEVG